MSSENPYKPPTVETNGAEDLVKVRIIRNIRAICVLYAVLGFVVTLGGSALMLTDDEAGGLGILAFAAGVWSLVSAVGLLRRQKWGVPFCQIVSGFYVLSFPIGTLLGAYFLFNIGKVKDDLVED